MPHPELQPLEPRARLTARCPTPWSLPVSPLNSPSSPALTFPPSTGQGAAHAVRVGALPRPGRTQPLRSLAASGHLRLQYRAGPLSVVAMTGGFWAGSAHSGHPRTGVCLQQLDLWGQDCWFSTRVTGSSWMGKGWQPQRLLSTLRARAAPLPCGAAGRGHCGAQARWCQGAPAQGSSGGRTAGPRPLPLRVAHWPLQPGHFGFVF